MGSKCITEPIKALGMFLSYDGDKNNEENFFTVRTFNAGEDNGCLSVDLCSINVNCP